MQPYNPAKIESKWQKFWAKQNLFAAKDGSKKPKFYCLIEFPYPSGAGLHVGHLRSYSALDAIARKKRMQGFNVLYPVGWDAFGLPAENYAIKTGTQPQITVRENIATFKKQIKRLGLSFDWAREINTTDPKYYKWTQWIFLQLFKHGLAYQASMPVNWCPSCKIGLANEEVIAGKCERCGAITTKKNLKQWMLKITAYAERLLKDLDLVDYSPRIREQQVNWIGRSEGAEIVFPIVIARSERGVAERVTKQSHDNCHSRPDRESTMDPRLRGDDIGKIEVFTTRPDTIFGATYMVVCPEHPIVQSLKFKVQNWEEVQTHIKKAAEKSDLERTDLAKEKTGVQLKGLAAINPANSKQIPIFVADYVLPHYGTGAIMAVPAHDQRDMEFAKKYNLPVIQTVALNRKDYDRTIQTIKLLKKVQQAAKRVKVKVWALGGLACAFYAEAIYRRHEDLDLVVKTEADLRKISDTFNQLGFKKIREKKIDNELSNSIFQAGNNIEIDIGPNKYKFGLKEADFEEQEKQLGAYQSLVLSERYVKSFKEMQVKERNQDKDRLDLAFLNGRVIVEDGFAVNSGQFDGLTTQKFKKQITQWLAKKKLAKRAVNYKLRDWVFSRQHYWGEPIPIVHCQKCGAVPVPEDKLPVRLPLVKKYQPTGTGESPLAAVKNWVNTKCPKCGGPAKRETDTMPNWAGSSWYFLRYCDPKNDKKLADLKKLKYWLPVDLYNGGMEHTTLHLLYSRFWHKFLYDIGCVPTKEPYAKRRSHGVVLAEDSQKMSKSRGNVINPDEMIKLYGADTLRLYEMFMGPFSQMIPWSTQGMIGVRRFLEKIWHLASVILRPQPEGSLMNMNMRKSAGRPEASREIAASPALSERFRKVRGPRNDNIICLLHQTIKKVSEDLDKMRFNTAVSSLMILTNKLNEIVEGRDRSLCRGTGQVRPVPATEAYQTLLTLLAPFAPHIAEELWQKFGHKKSIFLEKWPQYDPKLIKQNTFDLVVQINGKLRDRIQAKVGLGQKEAEKLVIASPKIKQFLSGKQIKKIIFVKDRLINLVV